jgi:glycogen(starch) synthase
MRVLVWSDLFWPYIGGPELLAARLMQELRERGYEFTVVTSHDYLELPDEANYDGIRILRFPFRAAIRARDPGAVHRARRAAAEFKSAYAPDLVHANATGPSVFFHIRTAGAHTAPSLVALHTEVLASQAVGPDTVLEEAMSSATWVTACSDAVLTQARRVAPGIAARSSVLRHGVDLGREPGGELPTPPRLLCLGRLVPAKGFDVALSAFELLVEELPALRLIIAGDGVARGDLERQAAALGVEHAVDFLGWVDPDKVPELIDGATVVLVPSRREGLSLAAVEAASRARPIVASRVGGLPEVVTHTQTGLLVEPDDPRGLADAIASLLAEPGKAAKMGRAGRERVRKTFPWDRYVDDHDALYRRLMRRYR